MVEEKWGERVKLNGKDWLYHTPLKGNVAIIEAKTADTAGNLVFHLTQRSFSVAMCYAAELVIVEVTGGIVPVGSIPPEHVDVPGIVVDILVRGKEAAK
jgi:acyl CoA:acetate/3-ketoacid CoA transferase alpha subunit